MILKLGSTPRWCLTGAPNHNIPPPAVFAESVGDSQHLFIEQQTQADNSASKKKKKGTRSPGLSGWRCAAAPRQQQRGGTINIIKLSWITQNGSDQFGGRRELIQCNPLHRGAKHTLKNKEEGRSRRRTAPTSNIYSDRSVWWRKQEPGPWIRFFFSAQFSAKHPHRVERCGREMRLAS